MCSSTWRGIGHDTWLRDFSTGRIDASVIQEYVDAAFSDGATTYGNQHLARLGSSGRHKGNIRRDLYRYTIKEYELTKQLDLYDVEAEFATKDCLGTIVRKVGMFLPHELFGILYSVDKTLWTAVFGSDGDRTAYWTGLREPWWGPAHPMYNRIMQEPSRCVPLRTHGDGGAFKKGLIRLQMLVFTIASPLTFNERSQDSILMVFALLLQGLQDHTLTTLLEAVSWSLNFLADGHWPSRDHKGQPLVGKRAGRQGPLADGYFAVATEHLGDWKYVKEVFSLNAYYGKSHPCHFCKCCKRPGPGNFADYSTEGTVDGNNFASDHTRGPCP